MTVSTTDARIVALRDFIDDAALFPPARLPMAPALDDHVRHTTAPYGFMVGRFLCPASRLPELDATLAYGQRLEVGVICDRAAGGALREALARDLFAARHAATDERVRVGAVEVALPADGDFEEHVEDVLSVVAVAGLADPVVVACEVPLAGHSVERVTAGVRAIARRAAAPGPRVVRLLVKLRCGGADASAYPSADVLAAAIVACHRHGVAWKATTGLHHPHPTYDKLSDADQYGFLNLLAAAVRAAEGAGPEKIAPVLGMGEDALRLDADGLVVEGRVVGAGDLDAVRERAYTGHGCCSIDDSVDDLTALGVLPLDVSE